MNQKWLCNHKSHAQIFSFCCLMDWSDHRCLVWFLGSSTNPKPWSALFSPLAGLCSFWRTGNDVKQGEATGAIWAWPASYWSIATMQPSLWLAGPCENVVLPLRLCDVCIQCFSDQNMVYVNASLFKMLHRSTARSPELPGNLHVELTSAGWVSHFRTNLINICRYFTDTTWVTEIIRASMLKIQHPPIIHHTYPLQGHRGPNIRWGVGCRHQFTHKHTHTDPHQQAI